MSDFCTGHIRSGTTAIEACNSLSTARDLLLTVLLEEAKERSFRLVKLSSSMVDHVTYALKIMVDHLTTVEPVEDLRTNVGRSANCGSVA